MGGLGPNDCATWNARRGHKHGVSRHFRASAPSKWLDHRRRSRTDRPALAPLVIQVILSALDKLKRVSSTLLIVEQKLDNALLFAERAYVLNKGRIVLEGSCAELAA